MPSMSRAQCHKFQGSVCRCCCNQDNCNNNVTTSCVIGGKPNDDDDHSYVTVAINYFMIYKIKLKTFQLKLSFKGIHLNFFFDKYKFIICSLFLVSVIHFVLTFMKNLICKDLIL